MQIDREIRSKLRNEFSRYSCEKKCPHLEVKKNTALCKFYNEYLAPDGSGWFMCADCAEDTYGAQTASDRTSKLHGGIHCAVRSHGDPHSHRQGV